MDREYGSGTILSMPKVFNIKLGARHYMRFSNLQKVSLVHSVAIKRSEKGILTEL